MRREKNMVENGMLRRERGEIEEGKNQELS